MSCFVHWIPVGSSQWRAMEDQILGEEKGWVLRPPTSFPDGPQSLSGCVALPMASAPVNQHSG